MNKEAYEMFKMFKAQSIVTECSDIAFRMKEAIKKGKSGGKVYTIESKVKGQHIFIIEHSKPTNEYLYHTVFVLDGIVYDPFYGYPPESFANYYRELQELNIAHGIAIKKFEEGRTKLWKNR